MGFHIMLSRAHRIGIIIWQSPSLVCAYDAAVWKSADGNMVRKSGQRRDYLVAFRQCLRACIRAIA
ncbi:hypothetical protein DMH27_16625 [Raoultella planticola]|nr:hypothetical protein [Raoultella planticola]